MKPWKIDIENYPLWIDESNQLLTEWLHHSKYSHIIVLCDTHTRRDCLPLLPFSDNVNVTVFDAGESHKNLNTVDLIWKDWMQHQLDRKSLVLLLGGGVVGDMGGFAAATFKRGIDFVHLPTSLMAMTDSSIGGKLGINVHQVKNAAGLFKNPKAIFINPAFLNTLPLEEIKSGWAEIIKHALIGSQALFENIVRQLDSSIWIPADEILQTSILIKKHFVERDPFETGIRKALNFGHTIGHALESVALACDKPISHGEAVCRGMVIESKIAVYEGLLNPSAYQQIKNLLEKIYPQIDYTATSDDLKYYLKNDKKNEAVVSCSR